MEYKMSREEFWQMIKEQKQNMKCDFCGNKGVVITTRGGSWICRKCFERVVEEDVPICTNPCTNLVYILLPKGNIRKAVEKVIVDMFKEQADEIEEVRRWFCR